MMVRKLIAGILVLVWIPLAAAFVPGFVGATGPEIGAAPVEFLEYIATFTLKGIAVGLPPALAIYIWPA